MEDRVKNEPELKTNVRKFGQRLKEDARACQAIGQQVGINEGSNGSLADDRTVDDERLVE